MLLRIREIESTQTMADLRQRIAELEVQVNLSTNHNHLYLFFLFV